MIEWKRGDMFASETEALVNTVNCVGVMGKGIAFEVRRRFPEIFPLYRRDCLLGRVRPGEILGYRTKSGKIIVNFPTKDDWRHPSRIEWIREGLQNLVDFVRYHQINSIAIPPLGCGNGGLRWADVRPLVEEALRGLEGVRVEVYEPSGS